MKTSINLHEFDRALMSSTLRKAMRRSIQGGPIIKNDSDKLYLSQWQWCASYRMIYFLYEVNCCFLSILLHKYLILCFVLLPIVEKLSFERNFGLIQQPNELASDYSYCFSLLWLLHARQIEMLHAKEGVLHRTQCNNVKSLRVNNASFSFFSLFHSIKFIFTTYFA